MTYKEVVELAQRVHRRIRQTPAVITDELADQPGFAYFVVIHDDTPGSGTAVISNIEPDHHGRMLRRAADDADRGDEEVIEVSGNPKGGIQRC